MTTQTIAEMTTAQLQAELNLRFAKEAEARQKIQYERERAIKEAAEVGKKEALIRVEEIKQEMDKLAAEMEQLASKHLLYIDWDIADGSITFSRWGVEGTGWDSSNC